MRFEDLTIPAPILEGIKAAGFAECTPVQALTLPEALKGRDIAAQAQTGTGKTAAFLITVFSRMLTSPAPEPGPSPRALVIAPTRELVIQIEAEARLLSGSAGFRIVAAYGGIDYIKQRDDIARGVDMLIGTPGRLIDYLKQKVYSLKKTRFLVIDEADRMFDMGFISDIRFLLRRMSPYDQRQSMLFSATLSTRVMELCYEHMNNPERFSATPEKMTVEVIEQELYHVSKEEKFGLLLGLLKREAGGHYIIFCNMKSTADRLKLFLNANGFTSSAITGDIPQEKRMKVLNRFKNGSLSILIATDVASRGLHVDGITHVINYDLPQDPEDYVHRIGRTARAGAGGKAISLACEDYVFSLPDIEEFIRQKVPVLPVTDELVVTDYKAVSGAYRQKSGLHPKKAGQEKRRGRDKHMKPPPRQESSQKKTGEKKQRKRRRKPAGAAPAGETGIP
ncbi:MAG TPA: DEAD/DEAH box helicase [Thermodesulfovibrionales bacterium]|nr:DEAD/DEAH box helicase [Thermodesulfovibrionales bacterium]